MAKSAASFSACQAVRPRIISTGVARERTTEDTAVWSSWESRASVASVSLIPPAYLHLVRRTVAPQPFAGSRPKGTEQPARPSLSARSPVTDLPQATRNRDTGLLITPSFRLQQQLRLQQPAKESKDQLQGEHGQRKSESLRTIDPLKLQQIDKGAFTHAEASNRDWYACSNETTATIHSNTLKAKGAWSV